MLLYDLLHNMCCNVFVVCSHFDADKRETLTEMLRAILAQREFTYVVNEWHRKGVHLYVPEVPPDTGLRFCEWEDVFEVGSKCTAYHSLSLSLCSELVTAYVGVGQRSFIWSILKHDTSSSVTVSALRGVRKQSVEDV